ncbi:MAG: hypothetical protein QN229_05930 [Desulfurococcaceae archaeon TW002]
MKCLFCSYEGPEENFKLLREPWKFRFYTVKKLQCPKCGGIFNYYSGVTSEGKKSEFLIKVKPRTKSK